MRRCVSSSLRLAVLVGLSVVSTAAMAGPISYSNFALDPGSGISYERTRSVDYPVVQALQQYALTTPIQFPAFAGVPHRAGGMPGIAMIDHDGDGDLDVYVANGPGTPNSLFVNQLAETGSFSFVDEGASSGAGVASQDSQGVCAGDLDNDGDDDLLVLGRHEDNVLLENQGDGTFLEVSNSGLEGNGESHISCSMGDVDADGKLDVFIGNAIDLSQQASLFFLPFDLNEHNQLYTNDGGLGFTDVSASSGILALGSIDSPDPTPPTITWAVSMVDVDRDGDIDILQADDQAAIPSAEEAGGGLDRGFVHVLLNDGSGHFTDSPIDLDGDSAGAWMGLAFGDLDCNGTIDVHSTNIGDYADPVVGPIMGITEFHLGEHASRWFLGNGDGTYVDEKADGMPTVFGWGNAVADLDNDGDHDILYAGGLDMVGFATVDNPAHIMENQDCSANFVDNVTAFHDTDYHAEGTQGLAVGDLNGDGHLDVVTTSDHTLAPGAPVVPIPPLYGSPLEGQAGFFFPFIPDMQGNLTWSGIEALPGRMTMEISDGTSENGAAFVDTLGGVGLAAGATNNRNGVGAIVAFKPFGGKETLKPVTAGASFLSQNQMEQHFGLGQAGWGTAEVHWPGGNTNRLYFVQPGETVVMPELPCDIDGGGSFWGYLGCNSLAVTQYAVQGEIGWGHAGRLWGSAFIAWWD